MRTIILFMSFTLLFVSCKKDDNSNSAKVFSDSKGTSITLSTIDWRTTNTSNTTGITGGYSFLGVNLKLVGSTNGDSVKIKTFGGGLINYRSVTLDNKKGFNEDLQISFLTILTTSAPKDEFTKSTTLLVFKGVDTLNVTLTSGQLKY